MIGFKSTAATILAEHPAPKVIADCSNELAFSLLKLDASSFVTRSSRKKYKPAPAVVLTIDALTPLHKPFAPFFFTTLDATVTIPRAPLSVSACIFVLTTSNGCKSALDTNPAEAPPRKLAAGFFFPPPSRALVVSAVSLRRSTAFSMSRDERAVTSRVTVLSSCLALAAVEPPSCHRWRTRTRDAEIYVRRVAGTAIEAYDARLDALNRGERLKALDAFVRIELPRRVKSRAEKGAGSRDSGARLFKDEYVKVVDWKLSRGKFRPGLMKYARALDDDTIVRASKEAFALAHSKDGRKGKGDLVDAIIRLL